MNKLKNAPQRKFIQEIGPTCGFRASRFPLQQSHSIKSKTPLNEEVREGKGLEPLCLRPPLRPFLLLSFFIEGRFWVYDLVLGGGGRWVVLWSAGGCGASVLFGVLGVSRP